MYNKGLQGMRALDETLALLRQEARQVSRATPADARRLLIREDIRRQNAENAKCAENTENAKCGENAKNAKFAENAENAKCAEGAGAKCVGDDGRPAPPWCEGDFDAADLSPSAVADDVAQRVARAEQTLYPLLRDAVAEYEWEEAPDTAVVERDANGAPLRIVTIRSPDRSCVASRRSAATSVPQGGGTESPSREADVNTLSFGKVYEYTPGDDQLKSALLLDKPQQCSSQKTKVKPSTPPTRIHGARGPLLSSEGTAVAKSSASGMARGIRRAVLARRNELNGNANATHKGSASGGQQQRKISVVCEVSDLPVDDVPDISFARIVQPLTAFFCPACRTCTARDLVTSKPDTCPTCHEVFDKLPSSEKECPAHARPESSPLDSARKKSSSLAEKKTTTSSTGTDPAPCARSDGVESKNTGTQAGLGVPTAIKNFSEVTDGLYFLHLWDQVMGECESS